MATMNNILPNQNRMEADIADMKNRLRGLEASSSLLQPLEPELNSLKSTATTLEQHVSYLQNKLDELDYGGTRKKLDCARLTGKSQRGIR